MESPFVYTVSFGVPFISALPEADVKHQTPTPVSRESDPDIQTKRKSSSLFTEVLTNFSNRKHDFDCLPTYVFLVFIHV